MNPLPVALSELRRTWLAAVAVVAVIGITVALGLVVTLAERGLRVGSARGADPFDLVVGSRGSATQLVLTTVYLQPALLELVPGPVLARLQTERGGAWIAPLAFGDSYRGALVVGATADFVVEGGRVPLAEGRIFQTAGEVVVGADVPLRLGETFSPAHGIPAGHGRLSEDDEHAHEGIEYVVVGRRPRRGTPWDRAIVAPIEAVWAAHSLPTGHAEGSAAIGPPWTAGTLPGVSAVVVRPRSVADAYQLRARYRAGETTAVFPAEVLVELYALLGDVRDLLSLLTVLTQALVLLAIALAVLAALGQRRRSIGILRALGASRAYVFVTTWLTVSLLVMAGTAIGLGLGWLAALTVARFFEARTGLALPVAVSVAELRGLLAVMASGALVALLPAWLGYRQPVAAALRS